jgi:hypothetical protein
VCITEVALKVDKSFCKQISKKLMITSRNSKKLKNYKVKITSDFKQSLMKLVDLKTAQKTEIKPKKVTPVKIFSCDKCKEKFTTRARLMFHYDNIHQLESEDEFSSGSEKELVIDEDVELVLENENDENESMIATREIKELDKVRWEKSQQVPILIK